MPLSGPQRGAPEAVPPSGPISERLSPLIASDPLSIAQERVCHCSRQVVSYQSERLGGHFDPGYTDDVPNAAASLRADRRVNPARMGLWGHSMDGHLTLRSAVVKPEWFKAAAIWAGVVAPYSRLRAERDCGHSAGRTRE